MTGKMPYDGALNHMAVLTRIIKNEKPATISCPEIPSQIGECIRHCWRTDPRARLPIAGHLPVLRKAHEVSEASKSHLLRADSSLKNFGLDGQIC